MTGEYNKFPKQLTTLKITIGPQTFSPIQYTSYTVGAIEITIQLDETSDLDSEYATALERVEKIAYKHFEYSRRLYFQHLKEAHIRQ